MSRWIPDKLEKKEKSVWNFFRDRCRQWRRLLGINNVMIDIVSSYVPSNDAEYKFDPESRTATITFDPDIEEVTVRELDYMAYHEIMHILLGEIEGMLVNRGFDKKTINTELHKVIIATWRSRPENCKKSPPVPKKEIAYELFF